ncbi:uncharacterized protein A4U43_C03F15160 [Asparagus officinalis]|uniref:Uncharacterized protein n=1 Tax=Asparagus officinalis TaxID=4686 RepID=A0A5P1FB41_ASPOF|nr:uncharacterized protein A4U43_C03F15160 [Asparagus officinalis]
MVMALRGAAEGIDERWDRIELDLDGDCKVMYGEGEVSLVHWSAMRPWERFHGGEACEDKLWSHRKQILETASCHEHWRLLVAMNFVEKDKLIMSSRQISKTDI